MYRSERPPDLSSNNLRNLSNLRIVSFPESGLRGGSVFAKVVGLNPAHFVFLGLFCETDPVVGIKVIAEPALHGIKAEAGAL